MARVEHLKDSIGEYTVHRPFWKVIANIILPIFGWRIGTKIDGDTVIGYCLLKDK